MRREWKSTEINPPKNGLYEVLNNSGVNNGIGKVYYDIEKGWDIPDLIRSFYRILKWRDL